jgi:hypothetical protein
LAFRFGAWPERGQHVSLLSCLKTGLLFLQPDLGVWGEQRGAAAVK